MNIPMLKAFGLFLLAIAVGFMFGCVLAASPKWFVSFVGFCYGFLFVYYAHDLFKRRL